MIYVAFFGVGNVELSINNVELKEWVKINFFPIACDSFGNIIVIGLCKCNTGKIYFFVIMKNNILQSMLWKALMIL